MAEEIGFEMEGIQISRARDLDLDLGYGHMAYRRASLIDLYLYTKFHSNRRNFLWTDGRTDGRTYGHFSPSNVIRSTFGSRPKKTYKVSGKTKLIQRATNDNVNNHDTKQQRRTTH